jgi:hypothetical protein
MTYATPLQIRQKVRDALPHRVAARAAYKKTEKGRAAHRRGCLVFIEKNRDKRAAHIAVGNALRDGKLVKGPCEVCGSAQVDAHHDDYSKPLVVRWLCRTDHVALHRRAT